MERFRVPLPTSGLSEDEAFADQRPGTARVFQNVRMVDPSNGRRRLAPRAGLSKHVSTQVDSTPNKVSNLLEVVRSNKLVDYTQPVRNLLEMPDNFTAAAWNKGTGATVNNNSTAGPLGYNSADQLQDGSGATGAPVSQIVETERLTNAEDYCFSVYVKQDSALIAGVQLAHNSGTKSITYDFTFSSETGNETVAGSATGGSGFEDIGSGWYRIYVWMEYDAADGAGTLDLIATVLPAGSTTSATGDTLAWGAVMESGVQTPSTYPHPTTHWKKILPTQRNATNAKFDRQANLYVLDDGSTLTKYNNDGVMQWQFDLPVHDISHVCRGLAVDDLDNAYVSTSEGTLPADLDTQDPVELGSIFKVFVNEDDEPELAWEVRTDGFVEDLAVFGTLLYAVNNRQQDLRSDLQCWINLSADVPLLQWSRPDVPYPAHGLTVNSCGEPLTVSAPFTNRGKHAKSLDTGATVIDWTPNDLDNASERIWSWHDGSTIDLEEDSVDGTGAELLRWRDASGNGRHYYRNEDTGSYSGPSYLKHGLAGRPGVEFNGVDQMLRTAVSLGWHEAAEESQQGGVPMHEKSGTDAVSSQWVIVMVIKPDQGGTGTAADQGTAVAKGCVFAHYNDNADDPLGLIVNRDEGAIGTETSSSLFSEGVLSIHTDPVLDAGASDGLGAGTDNQPASASYDNANGAAVVVWMNDGNCNDSNNHDESTRSLLRVNGTEIDRWHDKAMGSATRSYLGYDELLAQGTWGYYRGTVYEIVVLRRDYSNTSDVGVVEHPWSSVGGSPDTFYDAGGDSELERLEGYLAWKYGIQGLLASGHPFEDRPPSVDGVAVQSIYAQLVDASGIVAKYGPQQGKPRWALGGTGGIGYGVVTDSNDDVFTVGPENSGDNILIAKLIDQGDTVSETYTDGAWECGIDHAQGVHNAGAVVWSWGYLYPRLAVDQFNNLWIPMAGGVSTDTQGVRAYSSEGVEYSSISRDRGNVRFQALTNTAVRGRAVAVPPTVLEPDFGSDSIELASYVALVTANGGDESVQTVHRFDVLTKAASTGSVRTFSYLAVANGTMKKWAKPSTMAQVTGGGSILDSGAQYVSSVALLGKGYFADGTQLVVYDPDTNTASVLESSAAAELPQNVGLLEVFNGRLVCFGIYDRPHDLAFSAVGEPADFDYFPPVPKATTAVKLQLARAGQAADRINAFAPWKEDLAIIGGDHSLWVLNGDPFADGRLDLISDEIGMAWGRPWCKSPDGVLFFVGSRGSLFAMLPTGGLKRLSRDRIERTLQGIDFSTYYARLAWDYQAEGVHVFLFPFGAGGTAVTHYFYDAKNDSWSTQSYGSTSVQPTAALVVDADDPDDRRLVLGCEDSYLRAVDPTAADDDGTGIYSRAVMALRPEGMLREFKIGRVQATLASDLGRVNYKLFATSDPTKLGQPVAKGVLDPGLSERLPARSRGAHLYLELSTAEEGQRWALEDLVVWGSAAGSRRRRSG